MSSVEVKGMGNILNPDKENSFTRLVKFKDSEIFVDKTDFIGKMSAKINADKRLFAITRPQIREDCNCTYAFYLLFQRICRSKNF